MPADVGVGEFRDPPLLHRPDRLSRVAVARVGATADLDEHDRASVEGDDVDVPPQHPLAASDDPVAEALEVLGGKILPSPTERIAVVGSVRAKLGVAPVHGPLLPPVCALAHRR